MTTKLETPSNKRNCTVAKWLDLLNFRQARPPLRHVECTPAESKKISVEHKNRSVVFPTGIREYLLILAMLLVFFFFFISDGEMTGLSFPSEAYDLSLTEKKHIYIYILKHSEPTKVIWKHIIYILALRDRKPAICCLRLSLTQRSRLVLGIPFPNGNTYRSFE